MKLHTRPFMFCGLLLIFTLTSCSSSPSIEDQTKLIEYENCLKYEIEKMTQLVIATERKYSEQERNFLVDALTGDRYDAGVLEDCAKFRPKP